jgi:PAS domain S-box-containing protein
MTKQVQKTLGAEINLTAAILDAASSHLLIVVFDRRGRIVHFNRACQELTGYSEDEVKGKLAWEFLLVPKEIPGIKTAFKKLLAGTPARHQNYWLTRDGNRRLISWSNRPARTDNRVEYVVGTGIDITERREAEVQARDQEATVHALLESTAQAIVASDSQGRIVLVNTAAEAMFGYSRQEMTGHTVESLIPERLRERHASHWTNNFARPQTRRKSAGLDLTGRRKDGSEFPMEVSLSRIATGDGVLGVSFISDLTERRKAEDAVRESEERFRILADTAPVMIWMSGTNKLCTWFNDQWLKFVGRSMAQEIGNGWTENVHPEEFDRCLQTYVTSFDARKPFSMEYRLRRHDGQWRWILDNGVPRYNADGNFAGYIGSCIDVTSVRLLEKQRGVAERKLLETRGSLEESEATVRMLLNTSAQAIIAVDAHGRIVLANDTTASMFGYERQELLGKEMEILVPDRWRTRHRQHHAEFFAAAKSRPMGLGLDLEGRRKDGSLFPVEIGLGVVNVRTGTIGVAFVNDISQRRRLEEEAAVRAGEVRALAANLLTAQEEERRRVSRELHDQICQQLASLIMGLGALAASPLPPDVQRRLIGLQAQVAKTSEETRHIAYNLHSSIIDDLGLVASLRNLCDQFSSHNPDIRLTVTAKAIPRAIPREAAACIYRVAQEALQNVAKHANARHISVALAKQKGTMALTITDDGAGFDLTAIKGQGGLGLVSMRERARLANGELTVDTKPRHGTRVKLALRLSGNSLRSGRARGAAAGTAAQ